MINIDDLIDKISVEYRDRVKELNETKYVIQELEQAKNKSNVLAKDYFKFVRRIEYLKNEIKKKESFAEGLSWTRELLFKERVIETK